MIASFKTEGAEDIFKGKNTKRHAKTCPESLWKIAARRFDRLDSVTTLDELRITPGNRLELLAGDRAGQLSIRINEQYRICFT